MLFGLILFTLLITWKRGRNLLRKRLAEESIELVPFIRSLGGDHETKRVAGTAVFMTSNLNGVPHAMLHSLKHYKVLHERNVFLTVEFTEVPWVPGSDSVTCEDLGNHCWRVLARYGFMNRPDVAEALERCGPFGLEVDPNEVSWFLSREKIVPSARERNAFSRWRFRLFAAMARNAGTVTDFFGIPTNRVVELGTRVAL